MAASVVCPKCGKKNISVKAMKCPNCGYHLEKETKKALGLSEAEWKAFKRKVEQEAKDQVKQEEEQRKKEKKDRDSLFMSVCCIVVGVILIASVIGVLIKEMNANKKSTTNTNANQTESTVQNGAGSYQIDGIQNPFCYFKGDDTYGEALKVMGSDAKTQNLENVAYIFDYGNYSGCGSSEEMDAAFESDAEDAALIDYCWCASITNEQLETLVGIFDQEYGTDYKDKDSGIHYAYAKDKDIAYLYMDPANHLEYELFGVKTDEGYTVQFYMTKDTVEPVK